MDLTAQYWELVMEKGSALGLTQDKLSKLRARQILRSHSSKSKYILAAADVNLNIDRLRSYIATNSSAYLRAGKPNDQEQQKIEEQVGLYIRSSTANIQKLEKGIEEDRGASKQAIAHMHGVALILTERLQQCSSKFDACRSQKYNQLSSTKNQQVKRIRELQNVNGGAIPISRKQKFQPSSFYGESEDQEDYQELIQEQLSYEESSVVQNELQSLSKQVADTERSMTEIVQLNEIFSRQVFQQSETIEQLYNQAVEATKNITMGNVQLQKAIRLNSSTRKIIFVFFLIASLMLLFFDWWSS